MRFRRGSGLEDTYERILVWEYFDFRTDGFFVEVGAHDPKLLSQTWLLEKVGWNGILVEPLPDKVEALRRERPNSVIYPVAAGSREEAGEADFHVAGDRSALVPHRKTHRTDYSGSIRVKVATIDSILEREKPERIDFVSIDTEGHELFVLKGFDFERYRPALMLLEDSVYTLDLHKYMIARRYRLLRRTADNNWYVPDDSPFRPSLMEDAKLFRKMYLGTPLRALKFRMRARRRVSRGEE